MFLGGQPRSHPNRAGSKRPTNVWDLVHYIREHSMRNDNQILHGAQTGCEKKILIGFVTTNADTRARYVCGS